MSEVDGILAGAERTDSWRNCRAGQRLGLVGAKPNRIIKGGDIIFFSSGPLIRRQEQGSQGAADGRTGRSRGATTAMTSFSRIRRTYRLFAVLFCIIIGFSTMPMSVDSQSQARTIDGHSTAEYLRHLDAHVSEYESTLEKTKEMYKRIGELQQSPTKVSGGSPIRIHAEMATPSMCPGAHCNEYRFLAERLVPAALKEFSRRYRILAPMKGPLKLPRHCKAVLPSGSCTEVSSLKDQPPLCQNPALYAGYELCKHVDGNLHCVTMVGGKGKADTDFVLMVGMDPGTGKGPMSNNEPIKDVFAISGAFESEREEKGDARDTWDQLQEKPSGLREVPDLFDFHLRKLASSAEESARDERDSSEASLPREFRIADMCGKRGMSAYSGQCGYDLESGRPLAGYIIFCPSAIDVNGDVERMLEDVVHQILHAVYVSGNLVRLYEPLESGGKGKKDVLASTNPPLLRTPAAVKAARRHFGCGEMEEIELEDVPGAEDLVTSHWSTRLLAGELMTSHAGPHPSVLSALTAALAEDTGWYKHSGTTSVGILKHGLDAGCNFLEEAEKCNRPASVASSATFCPESSKNHRCTRDGRGHSPCKALEGIPGCYVVDEIDAFHDCGDPTSATSTRETMFGVYHGYKGRCMEVTKPITVSLGLREETLDAGAKCFKFECKNDELFLVLGFVNIRCPSGDFIDVSALDIDAGFRSGKLGPCPDNKAICNSMNCPMDCSSNGVCDPTSASGTCGCSLGHGFNRFADAREDCSAPLMCRNDTSCAPLKCDKVTGSCGFAVQSLSSTVHKTISELGFTKSITDLFDAVDIFATAYVNNQKLTHIAAMVMSLIDTDQDGTPDDGKLLKELRKQKPAVFIYADEADKERTKQRQEGLSRKDYNLFVSYRKQELFAEEIVTQPEEDDPLDAGMLGVLVLLFNYGWSQAYDELNKPLERAMDQAAGKCGYLYCGDDSQCGKWRGPDCDGIYHDGQDSDCDRDCLLPEYFALAVSASYGALDRRGACSAVSHVWSACSPEDVESKNSEFFETIAKYTSSDGDMPQRLSAREGGRIINAPLLPLGSAYRQYDAATYQVSLPLDTGFDELMIKGASREGETNVLKKQARAGSDTSDDGSSADTSNAESSSEKGSEKATADATDADNSFYGGSSNGGNTDLPGSDSFYSIYGYLSAGGQRVGSIVNNRMVLVGGGEAGAVKPGSLDDRQTWEQLVLGLIASMESRKEDGNEGSTRTLEIKCQRDRFDQCCDAPNLLDAAQGCCTVTVDSCGVCNGGDSSCSLRAVVRIEAREDLEIEKLVSRLKSELSLLLVNFMITPDHIKIDISGMEQVSRRRLLANGISNAAAAASARPLERSALQEGWLEVDVPFVVDPPDYKSKLEPPMIGEAAAFLSNLTIEKLNTKPLDGVRIVGAVQVDVTGICGNSICEFGEMTMPGGQPGSCPQDCPALEGTGAQLLPVRSHNRTGNGTEYNVCPDVAEVCDGNDADACYQATVAGTTPQCLGLDVSYSLDYEVPPLNPGTIAPRTIAPRIIAPCPTDNDGNCCAAPAQLDALRRCCQDVHGVDDCGVCGGRGITCAVTVLLQVAAPQTLEVKAFVEYVQDAVVDVLDIYGNEETGPQGTQFTVSVGVNHMVRLPKQTGCAGMLDGKVLPSGVAAFAGQAANGTEDPECRFGNEWLRLEFPVSILPANTEKALPAPSRQQVTSALGRAIDGGEEIYNLVFLSILGSNVTGVCGNRVCETGEMANPYKGTPGTCPGDCRADDGFSAKCPTPTASDVAALSVACGARGTCDESTGACTCWRGYVGPDCSRCGEGYAPFDGECLKEPSLEPVLLDPTVPVSALQAPEGKQDPWTLVLFVGVASGACLLVACLVVAFLLWRRSLARQPAKHLSKANAYPPMGVESIVATNGFTNFSMEHAGALEEVKKGPEGNSPDPARYAEIQRGQLEQGEQRLSRPVNIHEVSFDVSDLAGDAERGDAEIMAAGPHTSQAAAEAQGPKPRSAPELDHSVSFPPPRISRLG